MISVRKHAVLDDALFVIGIAPTAVECRDALLEPGRDPIPLLRCNDARDDVERPRAID